MHDGIISDIDEYILKARKLGLPPRCPFVHPRKCQRLYESRRMMQHFMGGIPIETVSNKEWTDDLYPSPTVSLGRSEGSWDGFTDFCPEQVFGQFGVFASGLWKFADGLDSDSASKKYEHWDPKRIWSAIFEQTFWECPEFSVLYGCETKRPLKINTDPITTRTRWEVFSRDGFVCHYCGGKPPDKILEVDHKIPRAEGGKTEIDNLVTACFECNRGKGKKNGTTSLG